MNYRDIIKKLQLTYQYLNDKKLKDALSQIGEMVKETHKSELIDNHYNIEMTYKSMLHFTVEGFTDAGKQEIYNHLVSDIFMLADKVFGELLIRFGEGYYYETYRKLLNSGTSFEEVSSAYFEVLEKFNFAQEGGADNSSIFEELNLASHNIFEYLLTGISVWKPENNIIKEIFQSLSAPWFHQCIFVSAITVQQLYQFNKKGIAFLFSLVEHHPNVQVSQRALVGLMLVLYKYDNRIKYYPEITEHFTSLRANNALTNIIKTIIVQLLRTCDTETLVKKLNDEILPEVAKIHPNLRNRLDLDNILGETFNEGKNPDWEDIFSDSPELMSKIEEFSKLQMEGADLFLSTFRMLKHFTFFNRAANWLFPFFYPNPIVDEILKNESGAFKNRDMMGSLSDSPIMCNSDKYSFILSVPQMPAMQKDMMGQMFVSELDALREIENSDKLIDNDKQALAISNRYIQDLYRFFKLSPYKSVFVNPFSWSFDFHNKWFINTLFPEDDLLNQLGEYLFEKDRYKEASEVFDILTKHSDNNPSMQLLQKQAFCQQQLNNYEEALKLYLQADLYNHGQVWNLKKIALCYRYLKNSEKAVEYYKEAERAQPDNLHTQVSIGHCLLELKNYDEALKYYFKVEYLDTKNKKVWRPIAWCSLVLGKFEQAEKYTMKNIDDKPTQSDYLNMGHIKWCEGNRKEALHWYQQCVKFPGNSMNEFLDAFENDKQVLLQHNVDGSDIPIMMDQLRYFLN